LNNEEIAGVEKWKSRREQRSRVQRLEKRAACLFLLILLKAEESGKLEVVCSRLELRDDTGNHSDLPEFNDRGSKSTVKRKPRTAMGIELVLVLLGIATVSRLTPCPMKI
jgi:hypothetical protein